MVFKDKVTKDYGQHGGGGDPGVVLTKIWAKWR